MEKEETINGVWRAHRFHDICAGHRVYKHESKCAHLHGHNYRFHFSVMAEQGLDSIGRVMDFSVIKEKLCMWLEEQWDHKFILWSEDPSADALMELDPKGVILVPFNPTAENMAEYMVKVIGPQQLAGTGVYLSCCKIEETHKCHASFRRD
mgnify:CR=1 FL=1